MKRNIIFFFIAIAIFSIFSCGSFRSAEDKAFLELVKDKAGTVTIGGMGDQKIAFNEDGEELTFTIDMVDPPISLTISYDGLHSENKAFYKAEIENSKTGKKEWDYSGIHITDATAGKGFMHLGQAAMGADITPKENVFLDVEDGGLTGYPFEIAKESDSPQLTPEQMFKAVAGGLTFTKNSIAYTITDKRIVKSDYSAIVYELESVKNKDLGIFAKKEGADASLPAFLTVSMNDESTANLYLATSSSDAENSTTFFESAQLPSATTDFLNSIKEKSGKIVFGSMPGEHDVAIDETGRRIVMIVSMMSSQPIFYEFIGMGTGENTNKGVYTTTNETAKGMLGLYAGFVVNVTADNTEGVFYRGISVGSQDSDGGSGGTKIEDETDFPNIWGNSQYKCTF